jgi:hypothetical protein
LQGFCIPLCLFVHVGTGQHWLIQAFQVWWLQGGRDSAAPICTVPSVA